MNPIRKFTINAPRQFLGVAALSARETARQPLLTLVSAATTGAILLFPLLLNYTLGDRPGIVRDCALSLSLLASVLLASASAARAVSLDIRRGPAAVTIASGTPRAVWFLGKCTGVALAMLPLLAAHLAATLLAVEAADAPLPPGRHPLALAFAALALALLLPSAVSWRTRRPAYGLALLALPLALAATLAACRAAGPLLWTPSTLRAAAFLALPALMWVPLAAALAVRLPQGLAFLLSVILFLLGILLPPLRDSLAVAHPVIDILLAPLPDLQLFWNPDALPLSPLVPLCALCWAAAVAALGILALRRKEIAP